MTPQEEFRERIKSLAADAAEADPETLTPLYALILYAAMTAESVGLLAVLDLGNAVSRHMNRVTAYEALKESVQGTKFEDEMRRVMQAGVDFDGTLPVTLGPDGARVKIDHIPHIVGGKPVDPTNRSERRRQKRHRR